MYAQIQITKTLQTKQVYKAIAEESHSNFTKYRYISQNRIKC